MDSNFREFLIGSRKSSPWLFPTSHFGTGVKMVSSFSTVLKDKISAIIEENKQMLLAAGGRKLVS